MRELSLKQTTLNVVKSLPENCSLEEVMYQINLAALALESVSDIKEGKTSSTNELLTKVKEWKKR